jgi:hypothetical protein
VNGDERYWNSAPYGPPPGPWPGGSDRPGIATAAAVLGFVTGGLTVLMSLFFVLSLVAEGSDPVTVLLVILGAPCAAGVLTGAVRLLAGHSPGVLFSSALASAGVLVLALMVGVALFDRDGVLGLLVFVLFALPLPVLTAVFARQPRVLAWENGVEAGPPGFPPAAW